MFPTAGVIMTLLVAAIPIGFTIGLIVLVRPAERLAKTITWASVIAIVAVTAWIGFELYGPLIQDVTTVTVPVQPMPVTLPPNMSLEGASAAIDSGSLDQAILTLSGLSWTTRGLLVGAIVLLGATQITIAGLGFRLARSLHVCDVFRDGARTIFTIALLVAIGGLASTMLSDVGAFLAGYEALGTSWGVSGVPENSTPEDIERLVAGFPRPRTVFMTTVPIWPLLVGLGLSLIGAAFRAGHSLRSDTQGLV